MEQVKEQAKELSIVKAFPTFALAREFCDYAYYEILDLQERMQRYKALSRGGRQMSRTYEDLMAQRNLYAVMVNDLVQKYGRYVKC
jgi:hypothetical protein